MYRQCIRSLDEWKQVGNAIMECATGKPGPLSDSDVCGVINDLRAQVAELQAWKDAVPVVGIKRLFRDAPYDAICADEVWQWITKMK